MHCLGLKKTTFYFPILQTLANSAIMFIVFSFINKFAIINSWSSLIVVALIAGVIGLFISFCVMFNKQEKIKLINIIKSRIGVKNNG